MSLQNVIYSNDLTGTSSSGASPIHYVEPWGIVAPDNPNLIIPPLEPSGSVDITTEFKEYYHLRSHLMSSFCTDKLIWWDTSHINIQENPSIDTVKNEHIKIVGSDVPIIWFETSLYFQWGEYTTNDITSGQFRKQRIHTLETRKISERFEVLAKREDNWDDYNSKKPSELILSHAQSFIKKLLDHIISAGYPWHFPFVSTDEDGYITVEWYEEERELHLLITENEVEYLQIWGTNIETEMREGILSSDYYLTLWEWLFHV